MEYMGRSEFDLDAIFIIWFLGSRKDVELEL
jgi:hypothetical protein